MGHRFKKMMKKTGHGLKKVGGFVLKTMGYAGKVGAGVVFLPISVVEGLVTVSNSSEPLDVTGIITGVVTAGVVLTPLAFSGPGVVVLLASQGFGVLSMPATLLLCNDGIGISDDNEKFCDNLDRVTEIVFSGPGDVSFTGGAWVHDSAGKLIKKIFYKKNK